MKQDLERQEHNSSPLGGDKRGALNRINKLLNEKENILSIYFTAGYPQLNDTVSILQTLEEAGVDLVEIGMPFSDPLADGPTIQDSSLKALENGMSLKVLFEQLKDVREKVSIPIILMGYFNTVQKFGVANFLEACEAVGVDGTILPDLPLKEYSSEYAGVFAEKGVSNIFLITPQTDDERVKFIDSHSTSFIYMVSSAAVTGAKSDVSDSQVEYFERVKGLKLKHPAIIGFGISNYKTFQNACQHSHGAIVGSAFIKLLEEYGNSTEKIKEFINTLRNE
jgi:tryptophan synthase alpha chain